MGKTYAFIDASNLFYGGEKSLGWKIDYLRLKKYLHKKYGVSKFFYFGGVEIHGMGYDYLKNESVNLDEAEKWLRKIIKTQGKKLDDAKLILYSKHLSRIKFYEKLQKFGYKLLLKPVKTFHHPDGSSERKANCDVDMAFYLMKEKDNFDNVIVLSGDGDFLPVLKYLRKIGKNVYILARGKRTAREIRQFAGKNFQDFGYLKFLIKRKE